MPVASLGINLFATTQNFDKRMDASGRKVKQFEGTTKSAKTALGGLKTAMGGLALGAVAKSVLSEIKETFDRIDSLAKLSRRIGADIGNLRGLQFAGEISGVEAETLNRSLEIFVRNVGDAQRGTGDAVKALDELGLSAADLSKHGLSRQVEMVASAMAHVEDPARKTSLAMDLFGRSGGGMVTLLNEGADGIRSLVREGRGLAGTDESIAGKVEKANDAMTRLSTAWEGLKNSMATATVPGFETMTKLMSDTAFKINQSEQATREAGFFFGKGMNKEGMMRLREAAEILASDDPQSGQIRLKEGFTGFDDIKQTRDVQKMAEEIREGNRKSDEQTRHLARIAEWANNSTLNIQAADFN